MELEFTDAVFEWRGPAPYHFVRVPDDDAAVISDVAAAITYGWGMVPVAVTIGGTTWTTSLWPKDGSYVVPLKDRVRRAESITLDDVVSVTLRIEV
jgi:hypothetical protein